MGLPKSIAGIVAFPIIRPPLGIHSELFPPNLSILLLGGVMFAATDQAFVYSRTWKGAGVGAGV